MSDQVRVVIIDDHQLFRLGVIHSFAMDDGIKVVGEGASREGARELVSTLTPDVVLLGFSKPDSGLEMARDILRLPAPPLVVMLTVWEKDDDVMRALEAGAAGYILKDIMALDLISAVKSVASGKTFVSPTLAMRLLSRFRAAKVNLVTSLSDQEQRVLRLVARGLSNREVADELALGEKTAKFHVSNIIRKLKVRNRVEATVIARREWGDQD